MCVCGEGGGGGVRGGNILFWDGYRWRWRKSRRRSLNNLKNTLMIHGSNVEQDETTCRVQE